jgi:MoaA/NifB/PqqE/SkfB family radical SAM enzyme
LGYGPFDQGGLVLNKLGVFGRVIGYKMFRSVGWPPMLPLNVTVGVTYRCNSRCKTCNIWQRNSSDELSFAEFDEVFRKLGDAYWFTLSGGEPFLRNDIVEVCRSVHDNCKPGIINIPTNGLLCDIIPQRVKEIVEVCSDSQIVVNVSMDGFEEQHDEIRGIKGNFGRAMKTYEALRSLDSKNFELGIHTVISAFNVHEIPKIYEQIKQLKPDSYITEIAEERVELNTVGANITPSLEEYTKAVDYLSEAVKREKWTGTSKLTQSLRLEYYKLVKQAMREKRQMIPCYAGFASAQIAPDGDVWTCCIRAEPLGNLRHVGYDFRKIWFGDKAAKLRKSIKAGECYCPLANASYTNMLCNFKTLAKVGWAWLS